MPHKDLREHLEALEKFGKLRRIKKEVDKDWEIAAVCRELFYRFKPEARPALLFENVKGFNIPVAAGTSAASPDIYRLGMSSFSMKGTIQRKWIRALDHLIAPEIVNNGPCKENITKEENVDLGKLPVPIWTSDYDPGPYITSACVITKDPLTKIRTGSHRGLAQDAARHIEWYENRGQATPVAVAIGTDPVINYVSCTRSPEHIDEFALAGALRGAPLQLVRCETIPLEVPATAEIILEGEIPLKTREHEGPFGEFTGYMSPHGMRRVFKINCITFRSNPIFHTFISQMPPSESSCMRKIGNEAIILHHLRKILDMPVTGINIKESSGGEAICVLGIKKQFPGQAKQLLHGFWSMKVAVAKILIIVDDDIDVCDDFEVERALSFRMQPEKDVHIERDERAIVYDPSLAPANADQHDPSRSIGSRMAIDATKKFQFPEASLPPREHLKRVRSKWEDYGI